MRAVVVAAAQKGKEDEEDAKTTTIHSATKENSYVYREKKTARVSWQAVEKASSKNFLGSGHFKGPAEEKEAR